MEVEDCVTLSEAVKMTKLKPPRLHRMIKTGKITAVKKGWVWLLLRTDVENLKPTKR